MRKYKYKKIYLAKGIKVAAVSCGLGSRKRLDLMLTELKPGSKISALFTKSSVLAAPVQWSKSIISKGNVRYILANSACANACTGKPGSYAVSKIANSILNFSNCKKNEIFFASTGLIGEKLEYGKIINSLPRLFRELDSSEDSWRKAAQSILTTDTCTKISSTTVKVGSRVARISAFAKGAGMIQPNLATMLAFIYTDLAIPLPILRKLLKDACDQSFNLITVDGDMSTNDTVFLSSTGVVTPQKKIRSYDDPNLSDFKDKLKKITLDLAKKIILDGEGAKKFVTINVGGGLTRDSAKKVSLSIANSSLVKTAIAGGDPNWGRIMMAIGKSGEKINNSKVKIHIGKTLLVKNSEGVNNKKIKLVEKYMKGKEINIDVDIGAGKAKSTIWTCDLTTGYVRINADYKT